MLTTISPHDAAARVQAGTAKIIDIRDPAEYAQVFIQGAHLVPVSIISQHPLDEEAGKALIFTCRSGNRTEAARPTLEQTVKGEAFLLDGGLQAWEKAGLPVAHLPQAAMPLFRQIQIAAGSLVLLGIVGSTLWHPFYLLSAFVGAGLIFAGLTGFCGMGILLSKMPWNKH
ncbi:MAG: rhodanese family protein [Desulfovibrionaceae bacterium]